MPQDMRICVMAQDAPSAFAQQVATTTVKLERGQELALLMHTTIDSESSKVGDRVEFQLARAVMSGNQIVLPAGWVVTAHVTKVRHPGKSNCKRGVGSRRYLRDPEFPYIIRPCAFARRMP
jgi:hypothetical protein